MSDRQLLAMNEVMSAPYKSSEEMMAKYGLSKEEFWTAYARMKAGGMK